MIRNYYTDSYKSAIPVVASDTLLLDGVAKIAESVTQAGVVNAATSRTFTLANLNTQIVKSMYLTAPAGPGAGGAPAITVNDLVLVEDVTHTATLTTITLNKATQTSAAQALTFFTINQGSWPQYNIYIGQAAASPAGTVTVTPATTASTTVSYIIPQPNIMAGMTVSGAGVPAGITVISVAANNLSFVASAALSIANNVVLTFSFATLNTLKVLTTNNEEQTFNNLQPGTILPVSVAQVFVTGTLGVAQLTALS